MLDEKTSATILQQKPSRILTKISPIVYWGAYIWTLMMSQGVVLLGLIAFASMKLLYMVILGMLLVHRPISFHYARAAASEVIQ